MQKTSYLKPVFIALIAALLLHAAPAFASRPGGGPEGPDQCTVMGEVTRIQEDASTAVVRLKQIAGSTTQMGCLVTGAQKMADKNTAVTVSLDVSPKPVIGAGDVVFVNIRSDKDVSLETFAPGEFTLESLRGEVQVFFDNKLERLQMIYAIKSYLGAPHVVDALVPDLIETDKEKQLSAALLLIVLADAKLPVPPEALQQSLRIGLMESRQTLVGSSIKLYPGDPGQTVSMLEGVLRDKDVQDPFAAVVALGEMGPVAAVAVPTIIERLDASNMQQLRKIEEETAIFATAIEKMQASDIAAKYFISHVKERKLKAMDGPVPKGMCALKTQTVELAAWCKDSGKEAPAPAAACGKAIADMDKYLDALPNTCAKDDDCDGYYFPVGGPMCPPAYMLPKSVMTEEKKEPAMKYQALVKFSCAQTWENKHAVCSPPPYHPACRDGKCVDNQGVR